MTVAIIAEKETEPINSGYSSYPSCSQQNHFIFFVKSNNMMKKRTMALPNDN